MTLLTTGKVTITQNNITTEYTAATSVLSFARSAVSGTRTCFNAVFAISLPKEINWIETTVKTVSPKTGSLSIATDTILSGDTRAAEMSVGVTGDNMKKKEADTPPEQPANSADSQTNSTPANAPAT